MPLVKKVVAEAEGTVDGELDAHGREGGKRDEETVLDLAVWDGIDAVDKLLSRESEISIPWIFMAIEGVHARWLDEDAKRRRLCWREYQKEGMLEFEYCLYGIFYRGHKHPDVTRGKCFCRRDDALPGLINYAAQCIRVKRSERDGGKLAFRFGQQIGHRRDPYCWEVGLHWK
ncbi:hypothetical protein QBC32DRAFT_408938 [Pseudoneurospora amorphoporcata]|uniref:Uncharacterized protein n=1 Tax=Pseudoneurospora amorphoporcata TaxID=241081 RepID=A0AAN6NLR5_9PEZI|nr:hypothetical protein QBC32DRAFT_408938 [Pseudoneurospora amorphoporcata]